MARRSGDGGSEGHGIAYLLVEVTNGFQVYTLVVTVAYIAE